MQLGGQPKRMILTVDLTKYHPSAKEGARCITIPDVKLSMWGTYDRFVAVGFDEGGSLDVLWSGLKEEETVKEKE